MLCKKCDKPVSVMDSQCPHCGNDLLKVDIGKGGGNFEKRYIDVTTPIWLGTNDGKWSGEAAFKDVGANDVDVSVEHWDKLNWSLINYGIPFINKIAIANMSHSPIENILIKIELLPDYGPPWQETVPVIPPKKTFLAENINLPISTDRLLAIREAQRASLRTEITANGSPVFLKTTSLEVLAHNEWYFHPLICDNLAGFILPNCDAVSETIRHSGAYLSQLTNGNSSFDGYQSGDERKVTAMVCALFLALQRELKIKYINPPASFEKYGQKIRFPEEILNINRGTCLDLALFYAACIEAVGLFPIIFLVPGHALLGVWLSDKGHSEFWNNEKMFAEKTGKNPTLNEEGTAKRYGEYLRERYRRFKKAIDAGMIMPLNSTTFTEESDFQKCGTDGLKFCQKTSFDAVIDVRIARGIVKPMPV
jgi:hypothetical protein